MQETVAGMPDPTSTTSSVDGAPVVVRCAPAALIEFAQPFPAAPLLPHGQGVVWSASEPSPKQNGVIAFDFPSSNTPWPVWVPAALRIVATNTSDPSSRRNASSLPK